MGEFLEALALEAGFNERLAKWPISRGSYLNGVRVKKAVEEFNKTDAAKDSEQKDIEHWKQIGLDMAEALYEGSTHG